MYTKQEKAKLKQAFWTTYGQYMRPILSADGERANWVNYKTGVAGIYFRMDADDSCATIAIEFSHSDASIREAHYEQLLQMKNMLHEALGEEWLWQPNVTDEYGKPISSVGAELPGVNVYRNDDWPDIISFLKQRIIALDAFWSMAKYGFE